VTAFSSAVANPAADGAVAMPRGAYVPSFTWRSPVMPGSQADGQMREVVAGWARGANISDRSRQLTDTLASFQELLEIHRLQIAAISSEIDRAWQILKSSRALLQGTAVGSADGADKTKARRNEVLRKMAELKMISPQTAAAEEAKGPNSAACSRSPASSSLSTTTSP